MAKLTKIKLNKLNKEKLIDLLNEGLYVERVEAVDFFNHIERNKELKSEKVKIDPSQYLDMFFTDKDATLYRDSQGRLYTDDLMVVDYDVKQKSEIEQTSNSISKTQKKLNTAKENKNIMEQELSDAKKEYERTKKAVTRAKGEATKTQIRDRDKALDKYKKIKSKYERNNETITKLEKDNTSWSNKENKIYTEKDVKSTDEMRELSYDLGLEHKKQVYSESLEKDLKDIELKYKGDYSTITLEKEKLINSRPDEVSEVINLYEKCPVTSSSQRQGKTIFVKNKSTVDGKVVAEGINDRIMDKATFGAYTKAKATDDVVDIVSLDTVASLPQSSRIGYAKEFDYKNGILVLEEVNAEVSNNVAEVYLDKEGKPQVKLISKEDGGKDVNKLFDGQALVDKSIMNDPSKPSMLLREKGFKANGINTNVQEALKDRYKKKFGSLEGYEDFKVKDMFGNELFAKDIKMITTDSAMKIYKLADLNHNGDKAAQHKEWLNNIEEGFSVVKNGGKHSKYGVNQRASYQITNTINFGDTKEVAEKNMKEFIKTTANEINLMKNSNEHYLDYLKKNADDMNNYQIELDLLAKNKNYADTQAFKDSKSRIISNLKSDVKAGKYLLEGDNLQVAGNPVAMLDHALGFLDVERKEGELYLNKDKYINEFGADKDTVNVYTKKFTKGEKLVHARSPHSNEASFVLSENVADLSDTNNIFEKYFNIDDTVCFIDGTNHASQSALGGQDYDSDINLVTSDKTLYKMVEDNSYGKTYTTVNKVPSSKAKYKFTAKDRALKDIRGSKSGIGDVANLTQTVQSQLTNAKYTKADKKIIEAMERDLHLLTNATNISIDNVKKPSALALFDSLTDEGMEKLANVKREIEKIDGKYKTLSKQMNDLKDKYKDVIALNDRSYTELLDEKVANTYNEYRNSMTKLKEEYSDIIEIEKEVGRKALEGEQLDKFIEYDLKAKKLKKDNKITLDTVKVAKQNNKLTVEQLAEYEKFTSSYAKLKTERDKLNKTKLIKEAKDIKSNEEYKRKGLLTEIQERDYYIKDVNGKLAKPNFFKNVSQSNDVKTQKMECNMDIMADLVEVAIPDLGKSKNLNIEDVLVAQKKKYDGRRVSKTVSLIHEADTKIVGYRELIRGLSDDEAKTYYNMIKDIESKLNRDLAKINISEDDMNQLIRKAYGLTNDKVSQGMKNQILKALYNKDKDMFVGCFVKGDSLLPFSDKMSKLSDKVMDNAQDIANNIIDELAADQDKIVKSIAKELKDDMDNKALDSVVESLEGKLSDYKEKANNVLENGFNEVMVTSYNNTLYNQYRTLGIDIVFGGISENKLKLMLESPFISSTFSKRMSDNIDKFGDLMRDTIVDGYKNNKSRWSIVKELEETTVYSKKALDRLVRTETTHFSNMATIEGYKEAGIEKYIFLATLDSRTSSLCRGYDGKVFNRDKAESGVNMPPLHPYCRSVTMAYYSDEVLAKMKRRARGKDGKNYVLDKYMTYEEWVKSNIK